MSFYDLDNICRACGGRWAQRPRGRCKVIGVGTDTRSDLTGRMFVALHGDHFDGHEFTEQAVANGSPLLLIDRDVRAPSGAGVIRVDCTRAALGRLAAAYRDHLAGTTVIAITGTVGKTTTKQLIGEVLASTLRGTCASKSFNNDIGVPLTLLNAQPGDDFLVVEIGMNAPGEIACLASMAKPDIAVITHVGVGHLEGVGTVEEVADEKFTLLDSLASAGLAIVNIDAEPARLRATALHAARVVTYGSAERAAISLARRWPDGVKQTIETCDGFKPQIGLPGRHNAINALAAIAVGRAMGVADEHIAESLGRVRAVSMRLEVETLGGMRVVNDAYNANPESTAAAIDTLLELAGDSRCVVVLGDMLELGVDAEQYHRFVMAHLMNVDRAHRIEQIVLIGPIFKSIAADLGPRWDERGLHWYAESGDEASRALASISRSGDVVLLKGSRGVRLERLLDALRAGQTSSAATSVEVKPAQAEQASPVGDA